MSAQSTYTLIASITLSSNGVPTFNSIPQNYNDLVLISTTRSSSSSSFDNCYLIINGDSGGNSGDTTLQFGSGASGSPATYNHTNATIQTTVNIGTSYNSAAYSTTISNFINYSNTTNYKIILNQSSSDAGSSSGYVFASVGCWRNNNAITSISFGGTTLAAGSTFNLYGIAGA